MKTFVKIVNTVNNSLRYKSLDANRRYWRVQIILYRYFDDPDYTMKNLDYYVS